MVSGKSPKAGVLPLPTSKDKGKDKDKDIVSKAAGLGLVGAGAGFAGGGGGKRLKPSESGGKSESAALLPPLPSRPGAGAIRAEQDAKNKYLLDQARSLIQGGGCIHTDPTPPTTPTTHNLLPSLHPIPHRPYTLHSIYYRT